MPFELQVILLGLVGLYLTIGIICVAIAGGGFGCPPEFLKVSECPK